VPEDYTGLATVALWYKNGVWKTGEGKDINHNNYGFVVPECGDDPLWEQHFGPLLPYMGKDAVITRLPPNTTMNPHIDRAWRAQAIYFPVETTPLCYSEYYDIPKDTTQNRQVRPEHPLSIYQYAIHDNAYLTNVHEWHGVRNTAETTRIAFGWNFDPKAQWKYEQCRDKMIELGYVRE
jgi:hypothetical protein